MAVDHTHLRAPVFLALLAAFAFAGVANSQAQSTTEPSKPRQLVIANSPWTGDFGQMLERRVIRVYAPFSRSLNYSDKGRERGIAVELVRDWERYLNIKYAKELAKRPLTIYVMPATRDKLLPGVEYGLADVAVGNLTVTEERLRDVDFVPGDEGRRTISEVVVTGPKSPQLNSLDDLEPSRDSRRLHYLRGWSHEQEDEVFAGGPRAGGSAGL